MNYDNSSVTRQNRTIDVNIASSLLHSGEWGVLSMADSADGGGYGVPVNYVWDGDSKIYIHSALEGRKLRNLDKDPRVTFVVVGPTHVIPERFTTERSSVMAHGRATFRLDDAEKLHGLKLLVEKFCASTGEKGIKYAESSVGSHRVEIIRIDVDYFTGKGKIS